MSALSMYVRIGCLLPDFHSSPGLRGSLQHIEHSHIAQAVLRCIVWRSIVKHRRGEVLHHTMILIRTGHTLYLSRSFQVGFVCGDGSLPFAHAERLGNDDAARAARNLQLLLHHYSSEKVAVHRGEHTAGKLQGASQRLVDACGRPGRACVTPIGSAPATTRAIFTQ